MTDVRHVDHRPGTARSQRLGRRMSGPHVVVRALMPRCALAHGARPLREEASRRLGVARAGHHRDRELQQWTQRVRIELGLAQPERPGNLQVGHGVGAGVRTDRDGDAIAKAERQHAMHELPAGGMAEQPIALPPRQPLIAQRGEQPFIDAIGPLLARVRRALLVVQVAEMIPEVIGKRLFGEFDGDRQDARFIHQPQPIVAIVAPIASDAMMHDQYRRIGIVAARPCAVQQQRAIGKRRIVRRPKYGRPAHRPGATGRSQSTRPAP